MPEKFDKKAFRLGAYRSTNAYLADAFRHVIVLLVVTTAGLLAVRLPARAQPLDIDGNGVVDVATTGTSAIKIFDVNSGTTDYAISSSGTPFGCDNVDANNMSAGELAAGFPALDPNSTAGDVISTIALKCQ